MEWKKIYNRIQLLKCFYRGRYVVSKEIINLSALGVDHIMELAKRAIVNSFSNKVISDYKHKISVEETDVLFEVELELFIIDKDTFKNMVETCVSMMPQSEIDRIRNNNK